MIICIPVHKNTGSESLVYETFSCAPEYVAADTASGRVTTVNNIGQLLQYGTCNPADGLDGHQIDAVIAFSIGSGMLHKLSRADIGVFQAKATTVGENLEMMRKNLLAQLLPAQGKHAHGG